MLTLLVLVKKERREERNGREKCVIKHIYFLVISLLVRLNFGSERDWQEGIHLPKPHLDITHWKTTIARAYSTYTFHHVLHNCWYVHNTSTLAHSHTVSDKLRDIVLVMVMVLQAARSLTSTLLSPFWALTVLSPLLRWVVARRLRQPLPVPAPMPRLTIPLSTLPARKSPNLAHNIQDGIQDILKSTLCNRPCAIGLVQSA